MSIQSQCVCQQQEHFNREHPQAWQLLQRANGRIVISLTDKKLLEKVFHVIWSEHDIEPGLDVIEWRVQTDDDALEEGPWQERYTLLTEYQRALYKDIISILVLRKQEHSDDVYDPVEQTTQDLDERIDCIRREIKDEHIPETSRLAHQFYVENVWNVEYCLPEDVWPIMTQDIHQCLEDSCFALGELLFVGEHCEGKVFKRKIVETVDANLPGLQDFYAKLWEWRDQHGQNSLLITPLIKSSLNALHKQLIQERRNAIALRNASLGVSVHPQSHRDELVWLQDLPGETADENVLVRLQYLSSETNEDEFAWLQDL